MATGTLPKYMDGNVSKHEHTNSNFTGTIYIQKIGPLVEVSAYKLTPNSSISAGGQLALGSIPEEFRPTTSSIVRGYSGRSARDGCVTIGAATGNMAYYNTSATNMTTSSEFDIEVVYFHV